MKSKHRQRMGKVVLVGAGPGDAGLLTLKGAEWLSRAEAVAYDRLANAELLKLAPHAEKIFVGKNIKGDGPKRDRLEGAPLRTVPQSKINRILVRLAKKGWLVVRLKGGDPFLFGRGGEEAEFLVRHGVPFEVVPGVSAGTGAPAYAGIPLTDRRFASQVTFLTGSEDPQKKSSALDWRALASMKGTLVSFMGAQNLGGIVRSLLIAGKSPQTPAAVIEWGTHPCQRVVEGRLADIVRKARKARLHSPALTVIGEVVRLRKKLAWLEKKPLYGKTVLVTRARAQASELTQKLREKGAEVFEFPVIDIQPPEDSERMDREIRRLSDYDWAVFTSTNGVRSFFNRMDRLGKDARIFSGVQIAAIGEATARVLAEGGLRAELIPVKFTSLALFESLKKKGQIRGRSFLLVRADIAPPDLKKALEREGGLVTELEAYRTQRSSGDKKELLRRIKRKKIDYVTFTSSSTVNHFFEALPEALRKSLRSHFISIGPVTSRTLCEHGFRPEREARVHTIDGLVKALCKNGE